MKILVIGSGGREHALAWRLSQSPKVSKVYVAPGNAGTARDSNLVNVPYQDFNQLIGLVQHEDIAFTVVGPEVPLAAGIVDAFRAAGLKIFGPTQAAARLESSKEYAKAFLSRHHIPTARYQAFQDADVAKTYLASQRFPIVIKADGLAAGKGVIIAQTLAEGEAAVDLFLNSSTQNSIVIEEFLLGEEASFIVMVDGKNVLPLATSQDHKRLLDGDHGPNTGGMGAYSPAPIVTPALHARVLREIIQPTIQGLASEGIAYTGFLYAGLMIDPQGNPKALEFNCRLGDPETQPIMLRLKSDLAEVLEHAIAGTLDQIDLEWDRRTALGVVLAAAGYPENPRKGDPISGNPPQLLETSQPGYLDNTPIPTALDYHIFHAGTAEAQGQLLTHGGRVLCVTALGDSPRIAQQRAYQLVEQIQFAGKQYRRDIGYRAIPERAA